MYNLIMANQAHTTKTHWAVIIGINYYPKGRCLNGSVRDAETVKHYLEAGTMPVDIVILTASTPPDPSSGRPIEEPQLWPTSRNVASSLRRIFDNAKPGDFVYVHYSGHGTALPSGALSGHCSPGELALVLFDGEFGQRYLEGSLLAKALSRMVERRLLVTLVLDCCFSGSVVRSSNWQGFDVRSIDYDPDIDALGCQENDADLFGTVGTLRDSQMERKWLVNPDGYTILSACGPLEKAWELEIEGGEHRGALTYFLLIALGTLRKRGVETTHQSLHEYICARFHSCWPRQTPMRYGNPNLSFFGHLVSTADSTFVSLYTTDDGRLCLGAGQAHGVCEDDEYAAYPFDLPERAKHHMNDTPIMLRVDTVRCFVSDLVEINPNLVARQIKTGWKAKPVTSLSPRRIHIRFGASIDTEGQWKEAAKGLRFLHLSWGNEEKEPYIFSVTINEHREYEVVDVLHEKVVGLPAMPLYPNGAIDTVMDVLQHLATFKYFEGVENRSPSATFEMSFSLTPNPASGESGTFEVKHGGTWEFTVENVSDKPLYMAIFNFTPCWGVINLVSANGGGDYRVVPQKEKLELLLQMEVPEQLQSLGETQCEDIVKVFITSRPTSFPSVILPQLALNADSLGRHVCDGEPVSKFLSELVARFRGQDDGMHGEWATRNFVIRTAMA
jgi:hypothetical protein